MSMANETRAVGVGKVSAGNFFTNRIWIKI